jgi:hypothetical protein
MKKFFRELDYSFVLLILYIIKSVIIPAGLIDVAIAGILALVFIARFVTKALSNTKIQLSNNLETFERFKFLEERSEENFRRDITAEILELNEKVSNVKLGQDLSKGFRK